MPCSASLPHLRCLAGSCLGAGGTAGEVVARRETALLRRTVDGAVWIGHVKRPDGIKLPTTLAFAGEAAALPEAKLDTWWRVDHATWQDIAYEESAGVGFLHFEFYNGAMSTVQCRAPACRAGLGEAATGQGTGLARGGRLLVQWHPPQRDRGGEPRRRSPADESWNNINAMNDLALELIETGDRITVAALGGNAGAGGCFLARAADRVWVRDGVLLNPHYKNMGNLYGSEYWTYLLPRRVGAQARAHHAQPPAADGAAGRRHRLHRCLPGRRSGSLSHRRGPARRGTCREPRHRCLARRQARARAGDEAQKPLAAYRAEELAHMRRNFYGFDPSYHVARHHFVRKSPASWTPRHLARHRDLNWKIPA
jgi:putative two-component system hydrogenase maturation factor HypX/HoxX